MSPASTRITAARISFRERDLAKPLVISSGAITRLTEAVAEVDIDAGGKTATGRGAILLSDLWAWPDPAFDHQERDARLRTLALALAAGLPGLGQGTAAHPLELGLRLHHHAVDAGRAAGIPELAAAMAASPLDAAIHDAVGLALGRSAFLLYGDGFEAGIPSADPWFPGIGACAAIRSMVRPVPETALGAWVLVGKQDDLEDDLGPWIRGRGYRRIKIKLMGADPGLDARRTADVFAAATAMAGEPIVLSVDTNEGNPDRDSVSRYLDELERIDAGAYAALAYLEQPTARDILRCPHDWKPVDRRKPVLLDEGLTGLGMLDAVVSQGWSGLALKTCKGHSFALVCAAWAHQRRLLVTLQDLTNPGLALVHAALFAAHVPTGNGVELNSPQFLPRANHGWDQRMPRLFAPGDGLHRLDDPLVPGLGSCLYPET